MKMGAATSRVEFAENRFERAVDGLSLAAKDLAAVSCPRVEVSHVALGLDVVVVPPDLRAYGVAGGLPALCE